jgi:hypothetical protein
MPDGSKVIMKEMYDAYHKVRTGQPAFHGMKVSDGIKSTFQKTACDVLDSSTHLSKKEEHKLNADCHECLHEHCAIWSEDWDDLPLPLTDMNVIVDLHRSGGTRLFGYETKYVRDDLPATQIAFHLARPVLTLHTRSMYTRRIQSQSRIRLQLLSTSAPSSKTDRPSMLPSRIHTNIYTCIRPIMTRRLEISSSPYGIS